MYSKPQNNDNEKLTQAHHDFMRVLRQYSFLRVHNKALSEDLVQETFLRAWKYLCKGGEIIIMKAFLFHILHGLIIDEYRKQKHRSFSLDILQEDGFDVQTDEHTHKGESIDIIVVVEYITLLPDKYREIVYMRLVLDMTLEEIALEVKKTKNVVSVQIHRGIKMIKRSYNNTIAGKSSGGA